MTSNTSSKQRKIIRISTDHYSVFGLCYEDNNSPLTFDHMIEKIKQLKQKYLEQEFLYKRSIRIDINAGYIVVHVERLETDKEYETRIKKAETLAVNRAKKLAEKLAEKKEKELKDKIKLFNKLKKELEMSEQV
jgi:hypothetical protein